jgi:hypothetical protein
MTTRWLGSALLGLFLSAALQAQDRQSLLGQIETTPGWEPAASPNDYAADKVELFDPKLAPALRLYGVKGVAEQQWKSSAGNLRVTLFEMVNSPAAYGLFTSQRRRNAQPTPTLMGADSFRAAEHLYVWQSNYVIKLDGNAGSQERLARLIYEKILGGSEKPPVAQHLPPAHIVSGTEKYVLSPEGIDKALNVDPNDLGFDTSAEAASAAYRDHGNDANLLLLLYPTHHIARKYAEQIGSSGAPPSFIKRDGPLLAIVYGSTDESLAKTILDGVSHAYNVTFDENDNPVTEYAQIILTIFKLLGIILLFSVVAGVAFAGIRIFIKSRYPDKVFDRYQDVEIIQLKLIQGLNRREIEK